MSRFQLFLLCAFALLLAVATAIYVQGANIAILEPAGPVAAAERNVIVVTFLLCALVVVPVFVMLFTFAWRYRAGNPAAHREHSPTWDHYNWVAEVIWWVIPSIIIVFLGILAWQSSHELDPYKPLQSDVPAITIDVVSLDWKWLFIYPQQGIASINLVEFPENTPIHFYLTSDAPMNSFWIPQLAGQIMTMPGMTTQLNLAASRTGDFNGFSGNISGEGFAGMAFTARSVSEQEFEQWVASAQASSSPLSQDSYAALAGPSEYNPVVTYSPVSPGLFDSIIGKYVEPGSAMAQSMGMDMDEPSTASSTTQDMNGMDMTP